MTAKVEDWHGLYRSNWGGGKLPVEALAHPAKFARLLIKRIYDHASELGWVESGGWIVDPFAGIGLGGIHASASGINWFGVEIERHYVNIFNGWDCPGVTRSESLKYIGKKPYTREAYRVNGDWIFCPECARAIERDGEVMIAPHRYNGLRDRAPLFPNPNLVRMVCGDSRRLGEIIGSQADLVISSPPYLQQSGGTGLGKAGILADEAFHKRHSAGNAAKRAYGDAPGNLSILKDIGFDLVISSPPFQAVTANKPSESVLAMYGHTMGASSKSRGYADNSSDNIGTMAGESFWAAAAQICNEIYQILRPGGHAIFVCKRYVKNGELVPFPARWANVCRSVGFRVVHWHRAWQVDEIVQYDIHGNRVVIRKEHKSFFRRNLEKNKKIPRIDWEDVICLEK